jgi:chromosome segregation ATPase
MSFSTSPDSSKLRKILLSITSELDSSFLEKRGRKNSHRQNPLEELSDAISELTTREQDLKAAAGIALMLLETNEEITEKLYKTEEKLQESQGRVHHYVIQLETMANSLSTTEEKLEKVKEELMKAEDNIFAQAQQIQLLNQRNKESPRFFQVEDLDFKLKYEKIEEEKEELARTCWKLKEKLVVSEANIKMLEEKVRENEYRVKLVRQKLEVHRNRQNSLRSELESSESNREACESLLKQANQTIQKLKMYTEKLEEEMTLHDNKKSVSNTHQQNTSSLYSELSMLDNYEEPEESVEDSVLWKKSSGSTRFLSIHSFIKSCAVCRTGDVAVSSVKSSRKPAPEEYFALATQAIKMNSPYMESICCVPTSQLYEKAIRDEIPFHKWHEWISKQLGLIYIDIIYKKNAKFSWPKNSQKKFLVSPT